MFSRFKKCKQHNIKLCEVKDYFCVTSIPDHKSLKSNLLDAISYEQGRSIEVNNHLDRISSTDYFGDYQDSYYKELFLRDIVDKYYQFSISKLCCQSYTVDNIWYQQYYENDTHNWHNHSGSSYSNVYFLELPSKEVVTEFLNLESKQTFTIKNIKEGDMLSFPGHIIHRSPKNKTGHRKTVIVFNSNVVPMEM